ncbi:hypothetical protein AJ80_00116 [Polytolypa hystricis UAMH7299]|uniref:Phytocyanin domain-containing protein n=1 Tax=Polytolypa hystricis (strain UAMH7299) TaxID=1447883 RepID=A0A2B7Z2T7_POLH7|nr:hypothetical protein AJ80_00116 [Polytolypa hystricis UAMH7299]
MKFSTVSLVAFASTATAAGYGQYPNPDQPEFYPTRQVTLTPTGAASSTVDGDQPQSYPTEQATSTVDGDEPQYYPTEQATSTVDGDEPQYYPTQKSTSTVDGDEPQYYPTKPATSTVDGDRPQKTHHVDVGTFDGEFKFVPNQVDAPVGDVVVFNFLKQSHSLTQSDFKTPCTYNGGFDTGLNQVNPKNESGLFEIPLEVTDTKPQWFYCKQQGPPNHCGKGMVFGLNPAGKMDQFVQNAIEQNGEKPDDPAEDPNEYPPEDPNEDPNEYPADDPSEDPNEYPTEDPNEDPNNGSQDKPNKGFWYFWVKAWRYGWHGKGDKGWNHGKPNEGTCPAPQTVTETATVTATVTYHHPIHHDNC